MRCWIIVMTICSLLSLPFSGSMAADSAHHSETTHVISTPGHGQHNSAEKTEQVEHCPVSMPTAEMVDDCCEDSMNGPECTSCPPDCGHCAMSDHCSSAALMMQQTITPPALASPVFGNASFYQRLSGQPTPPPIIS